MCAAKAGSLQGRFVRDVGKLAMRGTLTQFSANAQQSRKNVLALYKACLVATPIILQNYQYSLCDVNEAKSRVKNMFLNNKNVTALPSIDLLRINGEIELKEFVLMYKSLHHVEQILSPDLKELETPEVVQLSGQHSSSKFLKSFYKGSQ